MLELDDKKFLDHISYERMILMFYTTWCPLCPPIIEILTKLSKENTKIIFAKIDFDKNKKAVESFGIQGVPTVLVMKNGKILKGYAGLTDEGVYREIIENL